MTIILFYPKLFTTQEKGHNNTDYKKFTGDNFPHKLIQLNMYFYF